MKKKTYRNIILKPSRLIKKISLLTPKRTHRQQLNAAIKKKENKIDIKDYTF